ncbi:MAG: hypothetical protein ABIZ81_09535 [Opitutaceae bacterium]
MIVFILSVRNVEEKSRKERRPSGADTVAPGPGRTDSIREVGDRARPADGEDLRQAFNALRKRTGSRSNFAEQKAILEKWGEIDPAEALKSLENFSSDERESREDSVLAGWARRDAAAAWAWLLSRIEPNSGLTTVQARYLHLIESLQANLLVDDSMRIYESVPPGIMKRILSAQIAGHLARFYPERLNAFLESQSGNLLSNALVGAATAKLEEGVNQAISLVKGSNSPESSKAAAISAIFREWSLASDPSLIRESIAQRPPGYERDAAILGAFPRLVEKDPSVANSLLAYLSPEKAQAAQQMQRALLPRPQPFKDSKQ